MDKDFEKWLKQDDLYNYYKNNPEQQQQIYDDYLDEKESFAYENPDEWLKWFTQNYDLAKKQYPKFVKSVEQRIINGNPIYTANLIQRLPLNFYEWKKEIEQYDGEVRKKKIKEQITLLDGLLNKWQYLNEIINNAIESVRKELEEQLEFWKNEFEQVQTNNKDLPIKLNAKHYVLTYIIESLATDKQLPIGKKKLLEKIGTERMGEGKGNTFYKTFNKLINKDLLSEKTLVEIAGEDWRLIILKLTKYPNKVNQYLQSKQL